MTSTRDWRGRLETLDRSRWPEFLDEHSGLPGPRANLELARAVSELAEPTEIDVLIVDGDEYRAFCGAMALAARADSPGNLDRVRALAGDPRWRIREAVATGLQLLGERDFAALEGIVLSWLDAADPLVQRAAAAAICEPRLLRKPAAAAVAIRVCAAATRYLAGLPAAVRRRDDVRTLRQCLGYCWSVAVAADREPGLAAFAALDDTDPDVAWIVASNRRKKRLARLL